MTRGVKLRAAKRAVRKEKRDRAARARLTFDMLSESIRKPELGPFSVGPTPAPWTGLAVYWQGSLVVYDGYLYLRTGADPSTPGTPPEEPGWTMMGSSVPVTPPFVVVSLPLVDVSVSATIVDDGRKDE